MTDRLFALLLSKLIYLIAEDPVRWVEFRRHLLKVVKTDDAEQSRKGMLQLATMLKECYNMPEGNYAMVSPEVFETEQFE